MAERRTLSRTFMKSDSFLDLSDKAKLLYVYLGLEADDDGFIKSLRVILNSIGASKSDLQELISNGYIIDFNNGTYVITHWKVHNYLRADRYHKTLNQNEFNQLRLNEDTREYEMVYQMVDDRYTQTSIDKNRLGKTSQDETSIDESSLVDFDNEGINAAFDNAS